jgi:NAD+ kinase
MKTIAVYTNQSYKQFYEEIQHTIELILKFDMDILIPENLSDRLIPYFKKKNYNDNIHHFNIKNKLPENIDLFIVIGGDGTFLEGVNIVQDSKIPIIGINTGRLGFLTSTNIQDLETVLTQIFSGNYNIDKRSLLKLTTDNGFENFNYALNEFTIHKSDTSSMITIEVNVNHEFVNSYWADGLIISTPTGSTAYSLSAGGPIIHPNSKNLIITPIAVHNLNVRPLVVPDDSIISLNVTGRSDNCRISLDHRSLTVPINSHFSLSKAEFSINLLHCKSYNFYNTLRSKLLWGADKRN